MKKLIISLTLILAVLASPAFGEVDFDAAKYSPDQLAEIYSIVSDKLFDCVIVPQGYYVVGEDLPAGRYTVVKNSELPEGSEFSWVAIFNSIEDCKSEASYWSWDDDDSKCITWVNTLWSGLTYDLTDGMVLAVGFGTAGIRKSQPSLFKSFWN